MKRRAQLQIGESIMVILVLFILGIIVLVFYVSFSFEKVQDKIVEVEDLNAVETAQMVSTLYELRCSRPGVSETCFDIHKIRAFMAVQSENPDLIRDYYYDVFGDARVVIQEIYPEQNEFLIYEVAAGESQAMTPIVIPIPLYDSVTTKVSFGVLVINRYYVT